MHLLKLLFSKVIILFQLHQFVQNHFTSPRMALVGLGKSRYTLKQYIKSVWYWYEYMIDGN